MRENMGGEGARDRPGAEQPRRRTPAPAHRSGAGQMRRAGRSPSASGPWRGAAPETLAATKAYRARPSVLGFLLPLLVLLLSVYVPAPLAADPVERGAEHCVVNVRAADRLNLRAAPGTGATILSSLAFGSCGVIVTGACLGSWCPAEDGHYAGWVHRHYIAGVPDTQFCFAAAAPPSMRTLRAWPALEVARPERAAGQTMWDQAAPLRRRGMAEGPRRRLGSLAATGGTGPDLRLTGDLQIASPPCRRFGPQPGSSAGAPGFRRQSCRLVQLAGAVDARSRCASASAAARGPRSAGRTSPSWPPTRPI